MRTVAFFDLDNTLVRGSSLFHFGRFIVSRGFIPRRELVRFAKAEAQLAIRRTEPAGGPQAIAERVLGLARGRKRDDLVELSREFCAAQLDSKLVPYVAAELRALVRSGMPTYIVTASPIELASAVADHLGMTGALGTVAEVVDGTYSGRLDGPICHGEATFSTVTAFVEANDIALASSWAYSDSINDIPLLASAGTSVVVNPNRRFAYVAAKNGWRILDSNSNMINPTLAHLHAASA
jgi:HAD superfamily hydrolase (TIGR01490 family)